MYRQINMTDLIADNGSHYVEIVMRLVNDLQFWQQQAIGIKSKFEELAMGNNQLVAKEWTDFFVRVVVGGEDD